MVYGRIPQMKLQYVIENPSTGCLRVQPYFRDMMKYSTMVDYCRYETLEDGEWIKYAYRKPTLLCSNIPDIQGINKRCNCPNFRHASSIVGDRAKGKRLDHGGGKSPPMHCKHAIPTELHLEILRRAQQSEPDSTWVLDCFSGTQSLQKATDILGLKYVSADIEEWVKIGNKGRVKTDLVRDLCDVNISKLIKEASRIVDERPTDLLLLWCSPPCTTFSQCQTLMKQDRRHRDYGHPERPALSDAARKDDAMIANLVRQLL
jgi:hypothetical protein